MARTDRGSRTGQLVLIPGRDPARSSGGGESYGLAQAMAASRAGYTPHLFTVGRRSVVFETAFGVVHRVSMPVPRRIMFSCVQRPRFVRAVVRFLDGRPGPHVIHGFSGWADTAVASARALERAGIEAVALATVYAPQEHEALGKLADPIVRRDPFERVRHELELRFIRRVSAPAEKRALRAARVVVLNYESVRALAERAYGDGMRIRRLPYVAPSAFRDPLEPGPVPAPLARLGHEQLPLIVSVSRHDGRKGLDVLLGALAGLRICGVRFRACLLGTGILLDAHRRLADRLGLAGSVALPGRVPDVVPYLIRADVFVLPSLEEGSGSVSLLEALQAGTAIVASTIDGVPEDVTDGHDAILVPPGDVSALQAALGRLLGDPALRARLAGRARATYERRFTPEPTVAALRELYTGIGLPPKTRLARTDSATYAMSSSLSPGPEGR